GGGRRPAVVPHQAARRTLQHGLSRGRLCPPARGSRRSVSAAPRRAPRLALAGAERRPLLLCRRGVRRSPLPTRRLTRAAFAAGRLHRKPGGSGAASGGAHAGPGSANPVRPRRQPAGACLRPGAARHAGPSRGPRPGLSPMTLRVLDPGLHSLVVACGRVGYRSLGVPVGGAADRTALSVGNALVGNPPDAAALEISLAGPTLQADCELACVVYGAPFDLNTDRQRLRAGKTFTLRPEETLRIGGTPCGMRAYLC